MKKVIFEKISPNTIDWRDIRPDHIVIFRSEYGGIYMLQQNIDTCTCAWKSLKSADCYANGVFGTLQECLRSVRGKNVYVLDDIFEITKLRSVETEESYELSA